LVGCAEKDSSKESESTVSSLSSESESFLSFETELGWTVVVSTWIGGS